MIPVPRKLTPLETICGAVMLAMVAVPLSIFIAVFAVLGLLIHGALRLLGWRGIMQGDYSVCLGREVFKKNKRCHGK